MMESDRGHIVTVGSVTGMMGTYGCTDYSATKFACIGLHESLYTELKVTLKLNIIPIYIIKILIISVFIFI